MKTKSLTIFISIIMSITLISPFSVTADDAAEKFVKDGITYTVKDGSAVVTQGDKQAVNVEIPKTVEGYKVIGIEQDAFSCCGELENITLPEGMTYIGSYLLIPKESGDKNYLYLVYKMDAWNDSDGYVSYYIYIEFNNLRMVDGLCDVDLNDYSITSNYIEFGGDYYYYGFKNLDEVFSKCVTENLEYYTYDSTVEDVETSSATPTEAEEEE